jgi:hypothetical protein
LDGIELEHTGAGRGGATRDQGVTYKSLMIPGWHRVRHLRRARAIEQKHDVEKCPIFNIMILFNRAMRV